MTVRLHTGDPAIYGAIREQMDILDQLGISYDRVDHTAAHTIADCAVIEKVLGAPICKNLVLCNRQKTSFYLLLMDFDRKTSAGYRKSLPGILFPREA